jgi:hypothetical protein
MPNGLLPAERAGGRVPGRGEAPPVRGAAAPGAWAGPGRGAGLGADGLAGASRRVVSRCFAACWAARTAASCSAFNAAARTSAAATSMSCALAGFAAGAVGRGGPGTGPRFSAGRFGGVGRTDGDAFVAPLAAGAGAAGGGAAAAAALAPPLVSNAVRSRRATGASTVLDADFTYSPSSASFAKTVLLSTPSSFASSCTRALPATALLTSRLGGNPAPTSLVHLKPGHRRDFIVCSCRSSYLAGPGGALLRPPSAVPVR